MAVIGLPLNFANDISDNEDNNAYAPTDTAIITFSHPLCDKLSIHPPNTDFPVLSSIYLLTQHPKLSKEESFSFYRELNLRNKEYQYIKLFLYPGSNATYSGCLSQSDNHFIFFLVKGFHNFDRWKMGYSNSHIHEETINARCQDQPNSTYTFQAEEEDNYYLIYESTSPNPSTLAVTFSFERVLYDFSDDTIAANCQVFLNDTESCSIAVPLSSPTTALLVLEPLGEGLVEWDANIRVDINCHLRAWLYIVIIVSSLLFAGILIVLAIVIFICCCRKSKSSNLTSNQSPAEPSEHSTLVDEDTKPTYDEEYTPPPYER